LQKIAIHLLFVVICI